MKFRNKKVIYINIQKNWTNDIMCAIMLFNEPLS